jgi:hypothetical protein
MATRMGFHSFMITTSSTEELAPVIKGSFTMSKKVLKFLYLSQNIYF